MRSAKPKRPSWQQKDLLRNLGYSDCDMPETAADAYFLIKRLLSASVRKKRTTPDQRTTLIRAGLTASQIPPFFEDAARAIAQLESP